MTIRRSSRIAAWLALAGMVLNAAWPLLANAKPAVPASEICTASGGKHAGGVAPATPSKGYHASHCNLCPFGAERGAALPLASRTLIAEVPAAAPAFAGDLPPRPQIAAHFTAPPRAPPFPS